MFEFLKKKSEKKSAHKLTDAYPVVNKPALLMDGTELRENIDFDTTGIIFEDKKLPQRYYAWDASLHCDGSVMAYTDKEKVVHITSQRPGVKIIAPESLSGMCSGLGSLLHIDFSNLDTSGTKDISYMMSECWSLKKCDMSMLRFPDLQTAQGLFYKGYSLEQVDISGITSKNLWNLNKAFAECKNLTTIDLSNIQSNIIADWREAFFQCKNLSHLELGKCCVLSLSDIISSKVISPLSKDIRLDNAFEQTASLTKVHSEERPDEDLADAFLFAKYGCPESRQFESIYGGIITKESRLSEKSAAEQNEKEREKVGNKVNTQTVQRRELDKSYGGLAAGGVVMNAEAVDSWQPKGIPIIEAVEIPGLGGVNLSRLVGESKGRKGCPSEPSKPSKPSGDEMER